MAKMDDVSSPKLAYMLTQQSFEPEKYVRDLASKCELTELQDNRQKIQTLNDETAVALKKNVYKNYTQFIETSKEISYLEAEMYQLSHLLTEQKALLAAQAHMDLFNHGVSGSLRGLRRTGANIFELIEGLRGVLDAGKVYECVYEDYLTEIDPDTLDQMTKYKAFLFQEGLLVCRVLPERHGKALYKYKVFYDMEGLTLVNVRNITGIKNALKILAFTESMIYQAESPENKTEWLENFEKAKKRYLNEKNKPHPVKKPNKSKNPFLDSTESKNPFFEDMKKESKNPFLDSDSDEEYDVFGQSAYSLKGMSSDDWLRDLPDDLDVCIAQRDFEGSMDLIVKANNYLKENPDCRGNKEIRSGLEHRRKQLIETLVRELEGQQSILLHCGPNTSRHAVTLLIRLGRAQQGCELFLKNRSSAIKQSFRQLKIEGATSLYITKLSKLFFSCVIETGKEFCKLFSDQKSFSSAFVVWANSELQKFVVKFCRQVFKTNTSLAAAGVSVGIAAKECDKMHEIGLDLKFAMHHMLLRNIMEVLLDCRDQLAKISIHRAVEDHWRPTSFQEDVSQMPSLFGEMESIGIKDFEKKYTLGTEVNLSSSTIAFTKGVCGFLADGLRLYSPELHSVLVQCIFELFQNQLLQLENILKSGHFVPEHDFILKNASFMIKCVLPVIEQKLKKQIYHSGRELDELQSELERLQALPVPLPAQFATRKHR